MTEIHILSPTDRLLITLTEETGLISAPFREELNRLPEQPFSFTIESDVEEAKYVVEENQVVFKDKDGDLRLYVIKELDDLDNKDGPQTSAICMPAFTEELQEHVIIDRRFTNQTAQVALTAAVEGTRWIAVVEGEFGTKSTSFYYLPSVDAVWKVRNTWGGDIKDVVEFNGNQITARNVKLLQRLGADRGKRFEIDHDMDEIQRTVLSYPITALYGRGASLSIKDEDGNDTGGYTRYIDFADVEWSVSKGDPVDKPLGQRWVGDPFALQKYGRLHNGELLHREGIWSDGDIEDPAELLRATWEQLQLSTKIEVNYRLKVQLLEFIAGYEHEKARLGDNCIAVDRRFSRPIELQSRIIAMEYDLLDIEGTSMVEMGQFLSINEYDDRIEKVITKVNDRAGVWDNPPQTEVDDESFPDIIPPTPSGVTAVGMYRMVRVNWNYDSSSYIASYEVYASQVPGFIPTSERLIHRGKSGGILFDAGNVNRQWYFRVRMVNTRGSAGPFSEEVTATSVAINGTVDITPLTITNELIAEGISADKISVGVLDGHKVTVINLDATHIIGGDLELTSGLRITHDGFPVLSVDAETGQVRITAPNLATKEDLEEIELTPGPQGPPGADGKGIDSTAVSYQLHTSGVIAPTGTWLSSPPTPEKGKYLWTRTIITFDDESSTTTYSVSYLATDGQSGRDGKGIESTSVRYQLHTSGSSAPTGTWLENPPTPIQGRYLWTRTIITYSDSTNSVSYSTSYIATDGQKGDKGDTGPQGPQGIQGIQGPTGANGTSQYVHIRYSANANGSNMTTTPQSNTSYIGLANTTSATAPTGYTSYTWSLFKGPQGSDGVEGPKGSDGQTTYTWVRYADDEYGGNMSDTPAGKRYIGLAFNKTTATESSSASAYSWSPLYDNVQVGGRNLLRESNVLIESASYALNDYALTESLVAGEQVTITMKATLGSDRDFFGIYNSGGSTNLINLVGSNLENGVYKKTFNWSVGTSSNTFLRVYHMNSADLDISTIEWIKLERGNVATDYTLAPEDIDSSLKEKASNTDLDALAEIVSTVSADLNNKAGMGEFLAMEEAFNQRVAQDIVDKEQLLADLATIEGRTTLIETLAGDSKLVTEFINTVITESEEGVFIGSNGSKSTGILIGTDRISFMDNNTEVAYISNQTMQISHGIFVESATISDFKFEKIPGTTILAITWVGG
ncbi:phage tail spike protein [Sutcliffiella horikoshii]|uniref:phage tail spike protein n=1 Tax=Sutcliffiella horikoshii TaxID=79883 RepID=UPI003CFB5B5A